MASWVRAGAASSGLVIALLALVAFLSPSAAPARAASSGLSLSARIDGHNASKGSSAHPIRLAPSAGENLDVTITNRGSNPVEVRTVRLEGRVMGLAFFAYDTSVVFTVAPGTSITRTLTLDLRGLSDQASGLIPSTVSVLDGDRNELASQSTIVDVRGSLFSVYGAFGIAILVLTIMWSAALALALARGRLHPNRWRRAMLFLAPGLGIGLVFVFTLSTFRLLAPTAGTWIPFVFGSAALFMGVGYLTPTPDDGDSDDDGDDAADYYAETYPQGDRDGWSMLPVDGS